MPLLSDLHKGQRARITEVDGADAVAVRLLEMGLTEDEEIELLAAAPLGDPLEYLIRGYRISLRRSEAARIHVTPLA